MEKSPGGAVRAFSFQALLFICRRHSDCLLPIRGKPCVVSRPSRYLPSSRRPDRTSHSERVLVLLLSGSRLRIRSQALLLLWLMSQAQLELSLERELELENLTLRFFRVDPSPPVSTDRRAWRRFPRFASRWGR